MNKNQIVIIGGLAIAAVAAFVGLNRDRLMPKAPETVAAVPATGASTTTAARTAKPVEQKTEASAQPAPVVAQPKTAEPATTTAAAATTEPATTTTVQPTAKAETTEPAQTTTTSPSTTKATAETQPAIKTEEQAVPATTAPAGQQVASAAASDAGTEPSFDTVRVEKTGEAVIAGRAKAGAEVTVKLDGAKIGTAVANDDGAYVVVPDKPLPSGSGSLTVESVAKNETVAVKSGQMVAVIVPAAEAKQETLVAVVSPDQPTKVLQKPEPAPVAETQKQDSVTVVASAATAAKEMPKTPASLDAVDYDDQGNIVFSGRATPGTTARLYVDNALAGDAKTGDDGHWSFAGKAPISTGVHNLRLDGLDPTGAVVNRVEVPFFREEPKKVATATPPATTTTTTTTTSANTATASASPDLPRPKDGRVVIQPGNNLWRISTVIYGEGTKYTVLYEANKALIRDPDLIYPGQVFMTPDVVPPEKIDPTRHDQLKPEEGGAGAQ